MATKMMLWSSRPTHMAILATIGFACRPARAFSAANKLLESVQVGPANGATFEVYDPGNPKEIVGYAPIQTDQDVKEMIEESSAALPAWRDETTAQHRASLLTKWSQLIQEHKQDVATIMTLESGKPLQESLGEVSYGTSFLDYYAAEALRPTNAGGGFLVPTTFSHADTGAPRGQLMAMQQAIGVCGLITPWNFPIAMITRKVGPALAAGCTAIVKPSEQTPMTALILQGLAIQAGIPRNVLQTITTDREHTAQVGEELCTNPSVAKLSFTGSTAVGKQLMKLSSDSVKKLSLELGGNAPFVIFADADIDQAVNAAMASKFRNAGQTCVCADRLLIHEDVYEEFLDKLVAKTRELQVGHGMEASTTMGPLITSQAAINVDEKVQEALKNDGTTCLIGGSLLAEKGSHFYEPTVLKDVSTDSRIWKTETFGPVAACRSFASDDEALALANDCSVGLAAYFCTKDLSRAFKFAQQLECGIVGVNDGIISTCVAPFGGVKESGLGREGSPLGMAEYLETKYVFMNV